MSENGAQHETDPGSPGSADRRSGGTPDSTRQRILEAARELFHRNGYHATGIAAILKKAGVNSGSLYHCFPTKEDLLIAVLEAYRGLLGPMVVQPVFDRVSDPIERIFGILDGYRILLNETECTMGCPIGNLALEVADASPRARKEIAANFDGWKAVIESCLDEAADRLPQDLCRRDLASFVLTVMEGGVMQARAYRSPEPFESAVAQLRDCFDRLITAGSDWPPGPRNDRPLTADR